MQLLFVANPSLPFSCQQVSQEQLKLLFFKGWALSCVEVGLPRVPSSSWQLCWGWEGHSSHSEALGQKENRDCKYLGRRQWCFPKLSWSMPCSAGRACPDLPVPLPFPEGQNISCASQSLPTSLPSDPLGSTPTGQSSGFWPTVPKLLT